MSLRSDFTDSREGLNNASGVHLDLCKNSDLNPD